MDEIRVVAKGVDLDFPVGVNLGRIIIMTCRVASMVPIESMASMVWMASMSPVAPMASIAWMTGDSAPERCPQAFILP